MLGFLLDNKVFLNDFVPTYKRNRYPFYTSYFNAVKNVIKYFRRGPAIKMRLYFLGFSSIKNIRDTFYDQEFFSLNEPSEIGDTTLRKFKNGVVFLNLTDSCTIKRKEMERITKALGTVAGIHSVIVTDGDCNISPLINARVECADGKSAENVVFELIEEVKKNIDNFVGRTTEIMNLKRSILHYAFHDGNVLLLGETGTGKTFLAETIHKISLRKAKQMVKLNCATMPEALIESELFGHAKGAFTSADSKKVGMVEKANGGHMFLDEIAEISSNIQAKLLYVVDQGIYYAIGDPSPRKVDVKFISATNKNPKMIRSDLFFRLSENILRIPPLRQRKKDIPLIANHFFKSRGMKVTFDDLTDRERENLLNYNYPGNVRELENILEKYIFSGTIEYLSTDSRVFSLNVSNTSTKEDSRIENPIFEHVSSLVNAIIQSSAFPQLSHIKSRVVEELERRYVEEVLRIYKWDKRQTSEKLGITPRYLNKLIIKYTLDKRMKKTKKEGE